ncbi:MAG: TM2 domain-containing protein [Ignavibacteria bacterium]|nr:TM2 domain-containing protein [Ignavibacteria bacterium]
MNANEVNNFMMQNGKFFSSDKQMMVKQVLENSDKDKIMRLSSNDYKDPSTIFIMAWIGIDRFILGQAGLGILKIITVGGFGIWGLIDLINAKKNAQKYNWELFQKTF